MPRPFPVALPLVLLVAAGCQPYAARPLDFAAHDAAWRARNPSAAGVTEFARTLAGRRGTPAPRFDPSDGLSLEEAEAVALFFNPSLRAARLKARVPAVGAAEAGRWEDPELGVDAERIIESVEHPWVLGGVLRFTLPLSGRLGVERQKAEAEAGAAGLEVVVAEAKVLADLRAQWLELAVLDGRAVLARQYVGDLDEAAGNAERLRLAGELSPVEARLFRIEHVRRTGELRALELQRRELEAAAKATLGLTPDAPVALLTSLPGPPPRTGTRPRNGAVQDHPRLRLARAEYEVAERAYELEVRRQYPDLTVGGGFGTDEGEERVRGGLALPLPLFNANRRAIAQARAGRDAAGAAAEATYEDLVGQTARAELALEAARQRRQFLEKELAPLADEQLRDARQLGRLGDAGAVLILEALTRAYEAKVELLEAASKEAAAVNQLDNLLGHDGGSPAAEEKP